MSAVIKPATISFLKDLAKHNDKAWFDGHRDEYLAAKDNYEGLAAALLAALSPVEPALKEQQGKNCIFRIFRDVRFAKDKTPYKTHFGAYFSRGGRKWKGAGYYLHLEPGKSFLAAGMWMPQGALLKALRQEIDYSFAELQGILQKKSFQKTFGDKIWGEAAKTNPQGYTSDNPAILLLRQKSFIVSTPLSDAELGADSLVKKITAAALEAAPLVSFLNRAMG